MEGEHTSPDYIFEVSWEVCNKVGGIHTVLSTKARYLQEKWGDRFILIGPDLPVGNGGNHEFTEDPTLFPAWKKHIADQQIKVRTGRWNIPGDPLVILIDFTRLFNSKDEIFTDLWIKYRLDSLRGQWDYIEPALFGYAAGIVISCFYNCHINATDKVIAQFHEWLCGAGILYLEGKVPQIATVFTTHATVVGRSIAGAGRPFYAILPQLDADRIASEWNITAKHSLEKLSAHTADCFTCVSAGTAGECEKILGKRPDVITPNGFDPALFPGAVTQETRRQEVRKKLLQIAGAIYQQQLPEDSLLVIKSGRYEFVNKGIGLFIDSLAMLQREKKLERTVVAFIFVPAGHTGPVKALQEKLLHPEVAQHGSIVPVTHILQGAASDPILQRIAQDRLNTAEKNIKVIFAPVYLDGNDGIFNMSYYEVLNSFDLAVFPSYYEPWGYTPLESIAFQVPAITSSVTGFGIAAEHLVDKHRNGLFIIRRKDGNEDEAALAIADIILKYAALPAASIADARANAVAISRNFSWSSLIGQYYIAYELALLKSMQREELFRNKPQVTPPQLHDTIHAAKPVWRTIEVTTVYPDKLLPLQQISMNLWWTWHPAARELFELADKICGTHMADTPHLLLSSISSAVMELLQNNTGFMSMLQKVYEDFTACMQRTSTLPLRCYLSPEFALYNPLKIYAGGLGILAGDYVKAAADNGIPMIAIGVYYNKGYFRQQISPRGEQLAIPEDMQREKLPLQPVINREGLPLTVQLPFPGRTLHVIAWKCEAGKIPVYLLDTDIAANRPEDRDITSVLYQGDAETRLKQEIVLGIGAILLLEALDLHPEIFHINEGHAAFAGLARARVLMHKLSLDAAEAIELVKASTLFTTHTAVPAGIDMFGETQMRTYFSGIAKDLNMEWDRLMGLGRNDASEKFSMLWLATRLAQQVNAVSRQHQMVTRKLLQPLWKDFRAGELPVAVVTNGIHLPTWQSPLAAGIPQMADSDIWQARKAMKKIFKEELRKRIRQMPLYASSRNNWQQFNVQPEEDALFIGFARRFAPYKRAGLLFMDIERLSKIVTSKQRPVYFIFAGKAHPYDNNGIALLNGVLTAAAQPGLHGRIIFLEDHDMELSRILVQGVDLWLNTPRAGQEASGTSGMKAVANGALHCSTREGWWSEAYRADAGWILDNNVAGAGEMKQDLADAATLYSLLENEIIPCFFERDGNGIPARWISMIRASMKDILPAFDMQRVVADYGALYKTLHERSMQLQADNCLTVSELVTWKQSVAIAWSEIYVTGCGLATGQQPIKTNEELSAYLELFTGSLSRESIRVELLLADPHNSEQYLQKKEMQADSINGKQCKFTCSITPGRGGTLCYAFRITPRHPLLPFLQDFPLVLWA